MHKLVYLAAPLCSEAERAFNLKLRDFVAALGFRTYLPQLDGGLLTDLVRQGHDEVQARGRLFEGDCDAVRNADLCLAVLDGRTIDEGVCVELGIAFTLGKTCVGFKTDSRTAIRGHDNLMVEGCLSEILKTWTELSEALLRFQEVT